MSAVVPAEWVEIVEPRTQEHMYANLSTGECVWDPPPGVAVRRTHERQWWELFDQNTARFYYYNAASQKTVWHRPDHCDIIPLAKLQTLKQNTQVREVKLAPGGSTQATQTASGGLGGVWPHLPAQTPLSRSGWAQTSPAHSPQIGRRHHRHPAGGRHQRTRSDVSRGPGEPPITSPQKRPRVGPIASHRYLPPEPPEPPSPLQRGLADRRRTTIGPAQSQYYSIPHPVQPRSRTAPDQRLAQSLAGDQFRQATQIAAPPGPDVVQPASIPEPPVVAQRVSPRSTSAISRSISFMGRHPAPSVPPEQVWQPPPGFEATNGRRSNESTPQSGRRVQGSPESTHSASSSQYGHSQSDVSSPLEGVATPLIPRKPAPALSVAVESQRNGAPQARVVPRAAARSSKAAVLPSSQPVASPPLDKSPPNESIAQPGSRLPGSAINDIPSDEPPNPAQRDNGVPEPAPGPTEPPFKQPLNNYIQRYKPQKPRRGRRHPGDSNGTLDRFQSGAKMSPLQQYILEQAKLSGYRFGDALDTLDRDSYVESEDDWMNHHDDSDDFADDEDGGVSDDVSKASSVDGEDDRYLSEPTYNNLDPVWIQSMYTAGYPHHGAMYPGGPGSTLERTAGGHSVHPSGHHVHPRPAPPIPPHQQPPLPSPQGSLSHDVDAFSEEFDVRMRFNNRSQHVSSNSSTMPRPSSHGPALQGNFQQNPAFPVPYDVLHHPSLQRNTLSLLETNSNASTLRGGSGGGTLGRTSSSRTSDMTDARVTGSMLSVSTSIHSAISCESDIEKYAADNLNTQKKGLFRKKLTVKDILTHSKESLKKPLTCLADKATKKESIEGFRLMQIYMGDRRAKQGMTINSVALEITTKGYTQPKVRDEIYVQLCKQTTENLNRESLRRGWELMAICLAFFPPSPTFSLALHAYISKHRDPGLDYPDVGKWPIHVQISHYAGICTKRLERIGESGRLTPKKPVIEDIDQARLQIFRPSMFGGTLAEIMEMQKERFPQRKLPWILTTLAELIIQLNGSGTEGIFRVPADLDEVNNVKNRFDQWEIPACADCHTAASLLKLWFRELYEPLIPDVLYEECVLVGEDVQVACDLAARIPPPNQEVLLFLVRFLQLFSSPKVAITTKMDASNLSTVFAPNCLRCPSDDPSVILENTRKEMAFVKALIFGLDTSSIEGVL
eukprot:snap_masked-scaffold42_size484952-processed-gene-1.9 protein:Tk06358 transcript:snap_masked-scaffold42_size484952-processed-gene-1.9-mRNA-1 annotation:"hypothetical protein Phum_PHUM046570"